MPAMSPEQPVIGFLTDFGLDGAAATCRAVILGICRGAQIVDICHTVRKYAIADGAYILRTALPYFPIGVHLAVVAPGVGTARRPIAIRTGRGDVLVGPDNGLLPVPADALGGVSAARALENRDYWLGSPTSSTFHGRDIFAPVTGNLAAARARFEDLGPSVPVDELVRLPAPAATARPGKLETVVTYVDSFGNLRLAGGELEAATLLGGDGSQAQLAVEFTGGEGNRAAQAAARFGATFGSVPRGESLLFVDSSGDLAFADNQGNAAQRLRVANGDP